MCVRMCVCVRPNFVMRGKKGVGEEGGGGGSEERQIWLRVVRDARMR